MSSTTSRGARSRHPAPLCRLLKTAKERSGGLTSPAGFAYYESPLPRPSGRSPTFPSSLGRPLPSTTTTTACGSPAAAAWPVEAAQTGRPSRMAAPPHRSRLSWPLPEQPFGSAPRTGRCTLPERRKRRGAKSSSRSGMAAGSAPWASTAAAGSGPAATTATSASVRPAAPGRSGTSGNGLYPEGRIAIHADREGTLWFAANGHGLQQWIGEAWSHRNLWHSDGLPQRRALVFGLSATHDGGFLAAVFNRGIWHWDGRRMRQYGEAEGLVRDVRMAVEPRPGTIWVGVRFGIYESRDGGRFRQVLELPEGFVYGFYRSPTGDWYAPSSAMGIYRLSADGWQSAEELNRDLPDANVRGLLWRKNGDLWAATMGGIVAFEKDGAKLMGALTGGVNALLGSGRASLVRRLRGHPHLERRRRKPPTHHGRRPYQVIPCTPWREPPAGRCGSAGPTASDASRTDDGRATTSRAA